MKNITFARLNPFTQLGNVPSIKKLKRLLISAFLLWVPSGALQAVFSQFTIDTFKLEITMIGLMFSIIGVQDIISQAFIMPKLLMKFSDKKIAMFGMISKSVDSSEQGRVQGGTQSIQSLARIIGPIIGGQIYVSFGHAAPALMGVILISTSVVFLCKKI